MGPIKAVNNTETVSALQAQIDALKAQLSAEKGKIRSTFRLGVSTKGAVSVYGLGRFPVTLYAQQWTRLSGHMNEVQSFIADNKSRLKYLPDSE